LIVRIQGCELAHTVSDIVMVGVNRALYWHGDCAATCQTEAAALSNVDCLEDASGLTVKLDLRGDV